MINIAINNTEGLYEAPDSAIAQLEAHETITGAKDGDDTLFSIPFHAIDYVTVERTPITPVTHSDDNCPGGSLKTCDDVHFFSGQAGDLSEIHPGDIVHLRENQILVATNDTEPTEDNSLEITATSSNTSVATVNVIHEGIAWVAAFEVESQDGQTVITITVPSHGCQAQFTFETGII